MKSKQVALQISYIFLKQVDGVKNYYTKFVPGIINNLTNLNYSNKSFLYYKLNFLALFFINYFKILNLLLFYNN